MPLSNGVRAEKAAMFGLQEFVNRLKKGSERRYRLIPVDGWSDEGQPLPFHPPATLGRSTQADVRLADPWISRTHCELCERDGDLVVRDLESRHGVYVNDERVSQAVLRRGDVLMLGVSRFRIDFDETAPAEGSE